MSAAVVGGDVAAAAVVFGPAAVLVVTLLGSYHTYSEGSPVQTAHQSLLWTAGVCSAITATNMFSVES